MTAFERDQSPQSARERLETDPISPDSESLPSPTLRSAVTAISDLLGPDNSGAGTAATNLQRGKTASTSLPTLAEKPPSYRQSLLDFSPDSDETPAPQDDGARIPAATSGVTQPVPQQSDACSDAIT